MGLVKVINFDLSSPSCMPELTDTLYQINKLTRATRWGRQEFQSLYNQSNVELNLLQYNQQVVGFAVFSCSKIESYLVNLAVLPELQRQGFGRVLMEFSLSRFAEKGCKECWLEVRESNLAAQAFYASLGFRFVSTRKNFYQEPAEDGQSWVKKL